MIEIPTNVSVAYEMSWRKIFVARIRLWLLRLRFKLPYLVWRGDEIDVRVEFERIGALGDGGYKHVFEAQDLFHKMGIGFDTGSGCGGRDWEWDYSLHGPLHVKFVGRAAKPERRRCKPLPKLAVKDGVPIGTGDAA